MIKKRIHILQVVHSLVIGGTERVVCDLVRAFNDKEFITSVCCLDELGEFGEDLRSEGYRVNVLNRRPGIDFNLILELRKLYSLENIDLVHAHQYTPYFYSASASLTRYGLPKVILTEHGRHYPDRVKPKRVLFNQVLRFSTSAYTGVSEFTRQSLIRYEKMPARKIQVIYNGIWTGFTGFDDYIYRKKLRESFGLEKNDFLILSIGRMDPIKDFETLIKSFSLVAQQKGQARLWIAGGGDQNYRDKLVMLIKSLKLEDRVSLLGTRRDVDQLLPACDIFVLPSITEAASMTILEAMAAGKPVVATKTGGNPELVIQGKTGFLVPVGNEKALAKALLQLLKNPELRSRMGQAGRKRLEQQFTMDRILSQYRVLYQKSSY